MSSYTEEVKDATFKLIDFAMTLGPHKLSLPALLAAYATIAANHPCCVAAHARAAKGVADMLTDIATVNAALKH